MSSDYMVYVRTIFKFNRISEERIHIQSIVNHIKAGHNLRIKEWVQSDHPNIPDYDHPFRVTKIKFTKQGQLEFVELSQD